MTSKKKRERCIAEVHLLQQLNHPSIISMIDAWLEGEDLLLVMEWAAGGDLKRRLRKLAEGGGCLEARQVWRSFLQVRCQLTAFYSGLSQIEPEILGDNLTM